jgi:hypothetical protein
LLNTAYSFALEITVDTQTINIPAYKGFADVTNSTSDVVTFFRSSLPDNVTLKAIFVTTADAGALLKSKQPNISRYLMIQTPKSGESKTITVPMFAEYRNFMRNGLEKMFNNNKDRLEKDINRDLSKASQQTAKMKIEDMIYIPFESESDNHIACSVLSKYKMSVGGSKTKTSVQVKAGTWASVLLRDRIVNVHAYSNYRNVDDLTWTQKVINDWVKQITAANPDNAPAKKAFNVDTQTLLKNKEKYSTLNHPKANGLDVTIEYPASWVSEEGKRPHIVQKFTGHTIDSIMPQTSILVLPMQIGQTSLTEQEANEAFSSTEFTTAFQKSLPRGAKVLGTKRVAIDGEPGVEVQSSFEQDRVGVKFYTRAIQYMFFYNNALFQLIGQIVAPESKNNDVDKAFAAYLPIFRDIANSIIIHSKWNNITPVVGDTSSNSKAFLGSQLLYGSNLPAVLLFSIAITWGIGLLPPVLIRFALVKHSLTKNKAILVTAILWVLNLTLSIAMGRGHTALFLVAWASYVILRKKSKDEMEKETDRLFENT